MVSGIEDRSAPSPADAPCANGTSERVTDEVADKAIDKGADKVADQLIDTAPVRAYLLDLQSRIADTLGAFDTQPFLRDAWQRAPGERLQGDGVTRIIEDGAFFERGGVGFSHVRGESLPPSATANRPELTGCGF
jgi:hypothetical protein